MLPDWQANMLSTQPCQLATACIIFNAYFFLFGSFGILCNHDLSIVCHCHHCWCCHHHCHHWYWHLCTAVPVTALIIETWYLANTYIHTSAHAGRHMYTYLFACIYKHTCTHTDVHMENQWKLVLEIRFSAQVGKNCYFITSNLLLSQRQQNHYLKQEI